MNQPLGMFENILVLKKSALFSMVSTNELRVLVSVIEERHYQPQEEILREQDIGDSMYLIKHGTVQISKKIGEQKSMILAELAAGDCFGEMAAIDEEVRSADVRAKESCVLLKLYKDDLIEVIQDCPRIGIELLKIFVKRLRAANEKIELLSKTVEKMKDTV